MAGGAQQTPRTFVVTTTDDEFDALDTDVARFDPDDLSLREAIALANLDPTTADTITFADGPGEAFEGGGTVTLQLDQLEISGSVTIDGDLDDDGTPDVTIDANADGDDDAATALGQDGPDFQSRRVLDVERGGGEASVGIEGLVLTGGFVDSSGGGDGFVDSSGGGIRAGDGVSLAIVDSAVTLNRALGPFARGGGVHTAGDVSLANSTVDSNEIPKGEFPRGGGISALGNVALTDSSVRLNYVSSEGGDFGFSYGGGVSAYADVSLVNSNVSDNVVLGYAGARGGGIFSFGNVNLTGSTVNDNSADSATTIGGGIDADAGTQLTNSTVSGNSVSGDSVVGGGISTSNLIVSLTNSTVSGNSAAGYKAYGGGVFGRDGVTLTNSIVLGNVTAGRVADDNEISLSVAATLSAEGNNIVGADAAAFDPSGEPNITNADPAAVFDTTTEVLADADEDGVPEATGVLAGVLADNGGPTETIALLPGGLAVDAGDNALALDPDGAALASDQRGAGFARIANGTVDLGAFEQQIPRTFVVTTTDDELDALDIDVARFDPDDLSLREAIALANLDPSTADTITFDPTLFAPERDALIRLTLGEIEITGNLVVDGDGSAAAPTAVTITGDALGDDVLVVGTAITDVAASGAARLADNSRLFNATVSDAALTLEGLTLTGGRTTADNADFADNTNSGGAVRALGDLTLLASTVSGNSTAGDGARGGGVFGRGDVTLTDSTVSGNSTAGSVAGGGGVFSWNDVTLTNSTVSGNRTAGVNAEGGGIFGRGVRLTDSTVSGNSTAGYFSRGGGVAGGFGDVTLIDSTVSGNSTAGDVADGGGVYGRNDVTLTDSTVSGNSTAGDGADGGGVYGRNDVTLTDSTVSGNSTAGNGADGGGVFGFFGVTLTDSTVSGNSTAGLGARGGGIFGYGVTLTNSTVSGNSAVGDNARGGGVYGYNSVTVSNSIVLGNSAATDPEISGLVTEGGPNIIGGEDPADVFAAIDPATGGGQLADNGGPTETIALLPGGLAVDMGDDGLAPATDQRGVARPQGPASDLGAFELVPGELGTVLAAVNAGGAAVADYTRPDDAVLDAEFVDLGPLDFAADDPRSPALVAGGVRGDGSEATFASNIPGGPEPADDPVGLTGRFDAPAGADMLWEFDVGPDATVFVDLYFAEIWTGAAAPGARVFDVNIEGGPVELDDFDVYAAAGNQAERLVVETFEATVAADGILDILFTGEVQNPQVAALVVRTPPPEEVVPAADGEAPATLDAAADLLLA